MPCKAQAVKETCAIQRESRRMQDYLNYNYERSEGFVPRCFRTEAHVREYLENRRLHQNRSIGPNEGH